MRNFILYSTLFVFLVLLSCYPDPYYSTDYVLTNNSNHLLEVKIFNYRDHMIPTPFDTVVKIPINGQFRTSFSMTGSGSYNYPFGSPDSVFVIFNLEKIITYRQDDLGNRSILNFESYSGGKVSDYKYEYTYTITNEDYDNAIPLDK